MSLNEHEIEHEIDLGCASYDDLVRLKLGNHKKACGMCKDQIRELIEKREKECDEQD
tara:strand:- start:377 stop:547 length:171 start_codon:yes stop_codon:yes gene_type:complete